MKKQPNKTKNNHDNILSEIQTFFLNSGIELDINKQVDSFYNDPSYKTYKGVRNDKGYKKWKEDVIKRFENQCCVCYSTDKLISHHLYSYKYYSLFRTEINNGVCICNTCHELFNDLYSNVNTLEQFIQYRNKFKGKSHAVVKKHIQSAKISITTALFKKPIKKEIKAQKIKLSPAEQLQIDQTVLAFENLKKSLAEEMRILEKKFGREKGIRIVFRDKETTSLSATSKLLAEVMRLNTLISANKMKDKTIMASKFHMNHEDFCKKLQDPKEYLNFTASEITHLNKILSEDYKKEYAEERAKVFNNVGN